MNTSHAKYISILLFVLIGVGFIGFVMTQSSAETVDQTDTATSTQAQEVVRQERQKPPQREVKAIYLTAYSAGSEKKLDQMIDLINKTELNAVVIDIKDYSGKVLYDSNLLMVNQLGVEDDRLGDVKAMIQKLHDNDIYVIARQTVMQDPILARKKPEWAIKWSNGGIWRDYKGLAWVDPTQKAIWRDNVAIAKEAIRLGFDEINFDYIRFPSDGNVRAARYANQFDRKFHVMGEFYQFLREQLDDEPAWISGDLFGFVMEKTGDDDINIGQRLEDALDWFDYISPMMYPSHYPPGHLGLSNPAAHPGAVIENGMKLGQPRFEGRRAQSRPWLQAFNIGAHYGAVNIRAQIDKVEEYTDGGWYLWNAANRYSTAGLKLAE